MHVNCTTPKFIQFLFKFLIQFLSNYQIKLNILQNLELWNKCFANINPCFQFTYPPTLRRI